MALNPHIYLVPHFPGLLRAAASGREPSIIGALSDLGGRLRASGAEVVVILSAGWDEEGPFQVDNGGRHKTLLDFHGVHIDLRYTCDGWADLANALHENGLANGLPVETVHRGMDHSAAVPASLLFPGADRRFVPLSCSQRSRQDYLTWGAVVRETCRGAGAECVILAGGSLSCDPLGHAAGRDDAAGAELDGQVLSRLEAGDWDDLAALPASLMETGHAHAGLRHLWFLEGVLGAPRPGRVLDHHRLPGVGSALVEFTLPGA